MYLYWHINVWALSTLHKNEDVKKQNSVCYGLPGNIVIS